MLFLLGGSYQSVSQGAGINIYSVGVFRLRWWLSRGSWGYYIILSRLRRQIQYIVIPFINDVYVGVKGSQQVYAYQGGFQFRTQRFNKGINQYRVILTYFPYIAVKFREVYQETFFFLSYIVYLFLSGSLAVQVTVYSFKKYNQALY